MPAVFSGSRVKFCFKNEFFFCFKTSSELSTSICRTDFGYGLHGTALSFKYFNLTFQPPYPALPWKRLFAVHSVSRLFNPIYLVIF